MSASRRESTDDAHFFFTGYPGFIGRRLVDHVASQRPQAKFTVLVEPRFVKEAERLAKASALNGWLEILTGDVGDIHLGLSGEEYSRLCRSVTDVFHLAAIAHLVVAKEASWRTNVDGTRNILELSRECERLRRLNHFSSCYVSGDREGVIAEDELEEGQGFHNIYEETKYHAEKLVSRQRSQVPSTIYRPSTVIGDSHTGEIEGFDGPYYLALWIVTSPLSTALPLPGSGNAPFNVVPVDYLVKAVFELSQDARAVGRTFHLADPLPLSARRVYQAMATSANKRIPRFHVPKMAADAVLRLPLLERLARPQRAAITYLNQLAFYNCHDTLELLEGKGIRCPPLPSYLDRLTQFVRQWHELKKEKADPLDVEV